MNTGTGIFLGALAVALVALYIVTKDRWNWKRVFVRPLALIAALFVFSSIGWAAKRAYQMRAVEQRVFMGVNIADTKADIKFKKGKPNEANGDFAYADNNGGTLIRFKGEKIDFIAYMGECGGCNNLLGLGVGSSYDAIIARLGKPSYESRSDDDLRRLIAYKDAGVFFTLQEGRVNLFGIYDNASKPPKLK